MSQTIRELAVSVGLDVDGTSFISAFSRITSVKGAMETLAGMAVNAAVKFVDFVKTTAAAGKEIEQTAQATGLTTKSLQELRNAARASGVETEAFDTSMFRLSRSLVAAKKGGDEQAKAFAKLGTKATDAHGKLRDTDSVMGDLADGFKKMPDGAEKSAMAMEIFGRAGARMIPMLNKGKAGIDGMRGAGFVMSDEQIKAGKELTMTIAAIGRVTSGIWKSAIAPLLPAINRLLKGYLEWRKAGAELMKQRIAAVLGTVIKVIGLLGTASKAVFGGITVLVRYATDGIQTLGGWLKKGVEWLWSINKVGVIVGATLAAAWVIAAAPITAMVAGFAAFMMLLKSYDNYTNAMNSGDPKKQRWAREHTLFGKLKGMMDDWLVPNDKDPWWLKAAKDMVALFLRATGIVDSWKVRDPEEAKREEAFVKLSPSEQTQTALREASAVIDVIKPKIDVGEDSWMVRLGRAMAPSPEAVQRATADAQTPGWFSGVSDKIDAWINSDDPAWVASHRTNNLTFNINGGNPSETRQIIGQVLDERGVVGASHLEAAHAAFPQTSPEP